MYSIREVIESLIRKLQADVTSQTVLISKNDIFETTQVPSLIIQGPEIIENKSRRSHAKEIVKDTENLTHEERKAPRFYHLDFDFILTTGTEEELLDLQEKVIKFFLNNFELVVNAGDSVHMWELTPIGGLVRPNLTNLRQSSGQYRIEDVEIHDSALTQGKLIEDRIFEYYELPEEKLMETRNHPKP